MWRRAAQWSEFHAYAATHRRCPPAVGPLRRARGKSGAFPLAAVERVALTHRRSTIPLSRSHGRPVYLRKDLKLIRRPTLLTQFNNKFGVPRKVRTCALQIQNCPSRTGRSGDHPYSERVTACVDCRRSLPAQETRSRSRRQQRGHPDGISILFSELLRCRNS